MKNLISKKITQSPSLLKEVMALVLLLSAVFTFLSIWTYHQTDPSLFSMGSDTPLNACGRVGAFIGDLFIQAFGLGSFGIPLSLLAISISQFILKEEKKIFWRLFFVSFSVIALATFLAIHKPEFSYNHHKLFTGGVIGNFLAYYLKIYFNSAGSLILALALFLTTFIWSTGISSKTLFKRSLKLTNRTLSYLFGVCKQLGRQTFIYSVIFSKKAASLLKMAVGWLQIKLSSASLPSFQKAFKFKKSTSENLIIDTPLREIQEVQAVGEEEDEEEIEKELEASAEEEDESPKENSTSFKLKNPFKVSQPKKLKTNSNKKIEAIWKNLDFDLPSVDLLSRPVRINSDVDEQQIRRNCQILEQTLSDFNIDGQVTHVRPGPVVTMYEFAPGRGVKISKIAGLVDDLSLALSALSVRIVAPIPGKGVVGIEIPNDSREIVYMREILEQAEFISHKGGLPIAIGKTLDGNVVVSDLAKMPHLLVAGATGSGKSVFIHSAVTSLLFRFSPEDLRIILVDPKQLELNFYDDIPHLLLPVVTDPKQASMALRWAVNEMEKRYLIMSKVGVRNIQSYNEKLQKLGSDKLKEMIWPSNPTEGPLLEDMRMELISDLKEAPLVKMPYIVTIIDELADLMMVASKDVEHSIQRLAQKARAAGIHLILATQRPSVDVITGTIKANFPCRVAFKVSQKVDSRTILDRMGAEKLLGQGDMLFVPPGQSEPRRQHGAFLTDDEVQKICDHWREEGEPIYDESIIAMAAKAYQESDEEDISMDNLSSLGGDELIFKKALKIVMDTRSASASMLQRRLKIGYNRAARLVEQMEELEIVGPPDGSRPREVLKTPEEIGL